MRRWNGWGEDSVDFPASPEVQAHLEDWLGPGDASPDASLEQTLARVPPSRVPEHAAWSLNRRDRLLHARGQSTPDWIALRSGRIDPFPDAVAHPTDSGHLMELFRLADKHELQLIPYGGGTSVLGHVNPLPDPASVTVDMRGLSGLYEIDLISGLATIGAGTTGPEIEAALAKRGFTLGHFPQSFEYSTLGGWIATRSTGQQSDGYGRMEDIFRGGQLVTPSGQLDLPAVPASAAGPDLRQLVLGSEGRFGFITTAIVRVQKRPEREAFLGTLFPDWESGLSAARDCTQAGVPLSMLRLSDDIETSFSLATAGHRQLRNAADQVLGAFGYGDEKCLMIHAQTGSARAVKAAHRQARSIILRHGGLPLGAWIGQHWRRSRFRTPYLRNTLWEMGYVVDTIETALPWSVLPAARVSVLGALRTSLENEDERTLAFSHLSHRYSDGASLYFTLVFRRGDRPEATLARWSHLKRAAMDAILAHGGTLSHHHGVGKDHLEYLPREVGLFGLQILEAARAAFDPQRRLNPGKLLGKMGDQE